MNNFTSNFQQLDIPNLGLIRLPKVDIDVKYKKQLKLDPNCSNYEFLCALVKKGLAEKIQKLPKDKLGEYFERADYELSIFEELGFTDYVLLVWLVMEKVKELGAFCDFGRGSCAASFVFALIGITGITDVICKGLIFERFVSRVRSKKTIINGETYLKGDLIADADLNVWGVRGEIVKWLEETYPGKICKIATLSTLTGKMLIKDVYKSMENVSEEEAKRVADLVEKNFGIVEDISKMPEKSGDFKRWSEEHPRTFQVALKLRNLVRQKSCHPSGYFISYFDLDGFVPLELNKDKEPTLPYEMHTASKFGTKLDLLGLISNEILSKFFKEVDENVDDIDLDENPIVYNQFQNDDLLPYGLYQISASCAYKVLNKIKPKNIFELSDVNAIARPGALDYLDAYVNNNTDCPHPIFQDIVKKSRNLFLYQEQLMKALAAVGFTLDDAETCRKIVGKKLTEEVEAWEQKIYQKVKENNYPEELGKILWKVLNDSAKYSFNISHSLVTSKLSALTVWCKYSYPLQFYKACLSSTKDLPNPLEEISLIQKELDYFKIKLLPPHIFKSSLDFTIEDNNIRFGLINIKGVAGKAVEKLEKFRHPYANKFDIFQSAEEAKIPINILSVLVGVGAMDGLYKQSRSWMVLEVALWSKLTTKEKIWAQKLGEENDWDLLKIVPKLKELKDDKGKVIIKESRFETIKKAYAPYKEIYKQNSKNQDFTDWVFGCTFLGFSYGKTLKDIFIGKRPGLINLAELKEKIVEDKVAFVGQIIDVMKGTSKKGNLYIKFLVADETSQFGAWVFKDGIEQCEELNGGQLPKEGDFVIVRGTKKGKDSVFAEVVAVQKNNILMRTSQVKEMQEDPDFAPVSNIIFTRKLEEEEEIA